MYDRLGHKRESCVSENNRTILTNLIVFIWKGNWLDSNELGVDTWVLKGHIVALRENSWVSGVID